MGRKPCCAKEGLNRGAWTAIEDKLLTNYINVHGEGKWRDLPLRAGLKRCGKSCRLRWLNYLRPDIKRGNISEEEEDLIIKLHKLLGNRWSLIAGRLPGRTDNEIKNYWNTNLRKRMALLQRQKTHQCSTAEPHEIIRTKAVRCAKAVDVPQEQRLDRIAQSASANGDTVDDSFDFLMDLNINDFFVSDVVNSEFQRCTSSDENDDNNAAGGGTTNICSGYDFRLPDYEVVVQRNSADEERILTENWNGNDDLLQSREALELKTLESLLDSEEEWIS